MQAASPPSYLLELLASGSFNAGIGGMCRHYYTLKFFNNTAILHYGQVTAMSRASGIQLAKPVYFCRLGL